MRAGQRSLLGLGGGGSRDHYATPAAYEELLRALGEALASPYDVAIEATIALEVR